jgi:hypothetical protein
LLIPATTDKLSTCGFLLSSGRELT